MNIWWMLWPSLMGLIVGGCVFQGTWGHRTNGQINLGFILFLSGLSVPIFGNQRWIVAAGPEFLGALLLVAILGGLLFAAATVFANFAVWLLLPTKWRE